MAMPHFDSKHAGTIWWDDSDQRNKIMNVTFILIYICGHVYKSNALS